jgi:NAD(P)-dependent dehydrogenase (short-subunit alcohol dehydrogenase family)
VSRLGGRSALVTGAASGFGLAIARRFAAEGATVTLVDRLDEDHRGVHEALAAVAALGGPTAVAYRRADVADEGQVEAAVAAAVERAGRLDVMVNNAGVLGGGWIHEDGATAELRRQLDVNVAGVWHGCRAALAQMVVQGGGVILNTGSTAALAATPGSPAYGLAKAAVVHLTRSLAAGYGGDGVRVNAVLPGPAPTGIFGPDGVTPELEARYLESIALGRMGAPTDIAAAMAFLASDEASFVTGAVLQVDGGFQHRAPTRRPAVVPAEVPS